MFCFAKRQVYRKEKGIIHLPVLLLLLAGLGLGIYLVQQRTNLFPKASGPGTINEVIYIDTNVGCSTPEGLTPDQICQQQGFSGAVSSTPEYGSTVAQGFWWYQCSGASVSSCDKLDCNIARVDCTSTYQGQPFPSSYIRVGERTLIFRPERTDTPFESQYTCSGGYNPGWKMRVACSSPNTSPTPSPTTPPVAGFGRAAKFARGATTDTVSYIIARGNGAFPIPPEGPMTLEAWIKIDEPLPSADYAYLIYQLGLFNYPGGETLAPVYYLQLRGNRLTVNINDVSRGQGGFIDATLPPDEAGVWRHVAAVYDGQKISLFIDGNKKAETGNLESRYPFIRNLQPFYAGGASLGQNASSLPITLDGVRISDIARYTTDFQRPTQPFVSDSNTRILWHLDTIEDGLVRDSGPYGAHGEAVRVSLVDSTIPTPTPSPSPPTCTLNDIRAAFGARKDDPRYNPACDANNDGRISVIDYSALLWRR